MTGGDSSQRVCWAPPCQVKKSMRKLSRCCSLAIRGRSNGRQLSLRIAGQRLFRRESGSSGSTRMQARLRKRPSGGRGYRNPEPPLPIETTPQDIQRRLAACEKLLLVDVREPAEFQVARIAGAKLIPMRTVPAQLQRLEAAADEATLIVTAITMFEA